jgi:hypothetical protein
MMVQNTCAPKAVGRRFSHIKKPDFFIVGAPRCGTTAMFQYLSTHPEIYMPDRKEMHVFGSDLRFGPQFYRRTIDAYLAEFATRNGERRAGEASVWYLFSKRAAAEIKAFNPEASIVIMLREPTEMLHSMYHMFRYDKNEHLPTFEKALAAESARRAGGLTTRQTYFARGLIYREIVRYAEQVDRYFNTFGRDRVHVIIYDDLAADTASTYRETLKFLAVNPPRREANFEVVNPNPAVKSPAMHGLVNDGLVRMASLAIRPLLPRRLFVALRSFREKLMRSNLRFEKRPPFSPELRASLKHEFAPEVERLSELLGRDLTHWSQ